MLLVGNGTFLSEQICRLHTLFLPSLCMKRGCKGDESPEMIGTLRVLLKNCLHVAVAISCQETHSVVPCGQQVLFPPCALNAIRTLAYG